MPGGFGEDTFGDDFGDYSNVEGSAQLNGSARVDVNGTVKRAAGTLEGGAEITGSGTVRKSEAATLSGSGDITGTGVAATPKYATGGTLSGSGSIAPANARIWTPASATLSSEADIAGLGGYTVMGTRGPAFGGSLDSESSGGTYTAEDDLTLTEPDDTTESYDPVATEKHRPRPATTQPEEKILDTTDTAARTPRRRVTIDNEAVGADADITIRAGLLGYPTLDMTLWNLDAGTWARIDRNDTVRIDLGWEDVGVERVFEGSVLQKRRRPDRGGDSPFIVRGRATGASKLKGTYTSTYTNLAPHRIVELAASDLGLGVGYISYASEVMEENWAFTRHKPVETWFDELARRASRQTGQRWVWYLEEGAIYFHPDAEPVSNTLVISDDGSLVRATPVGETGDDTRTQVHEIVTHCEPVLKRGHSVMVEGADTIPPEKRHRVQSYTFQSEATTGRHLTTATIIPLRSRQEVYA